ncbi:MAG TPA: hypothetical protein V6C91_15865 [Coleofasciculaceae cyanobacterium]
MGGIIDYFRSRCILGAGVLDISPSLDFHGIRGKFVIKLYILGHLLRSLFSSFAIPSRHFVQICWKE